MKFNNLKFTLLTIIGLLIINATKAEVHSVNAGNYYYLPATLTISLGDTVNWYNDGGFHNVNAEINSITGESFYNPETFVSSATSTAGALIYSHVFNKSD